MIDDTGVFNDHPETFGKAFNPGGILVATQEI